MEACDVGECVRERYGDDEAEEHDIEGEAVAELQFDLMGEGD